MILPQSIRWRIQAWHGALLLAVIVGFGLMSHRLQRINAERHADSELQLRLTGLTSTLGMSRPRQGGPPRDAAPDDFRPDGPPPPPPPTPPPGGPGSPLQSREITSLFDAQESWPYYFRAWTRDGRPLDWSAGAPKDIQAPHREGRSMSATFRTRAGNREAYVFTPPGECLLVGRSTAPVEEELRAFAWNLAAVGASVLLLGLAGGWWMASRAIAPIQSISSAAARISGGNLSERISVTEAESELGQLTVVLNDAFARLDAAFRQQARFTSDAAHELRTPISVLLGQTQLALARERTAESYRETIEICRRAALRMQTLIESLLQLAMLEGSGEGLNAQPCDLAELSREQLEMLAPMAAEKGIAFSGSLTATLCVADADRISQILTNLLGNALKFARRGDAVKLITYRQNGCAIVSVEDTGPGIGAEHLPHLFERFYRADASRNRATGGAGLGLAICQSIAESHGGTISVESELTKGSRFTLRIPAEQSAG